MNILRNVINETNIDSIIKDYVDKKNHYMREDSFDKRVYLTKDVLELDTKEFIELISNIETLNNTILKKIVFHILKNDINSLNKIWMTQEMVEVMDHIFKKLNINDYSQLPLSYYWRYDLLLDEKDNKLKVVEIKSETTAWYSETVSNDIIFKNTNLGWENTQYIDVNENMNMAFYKSLFHEFQKIKENKDIKNNFLFTFVSACWEYFEIKKDVKWKVYFDQEYDEDYICNIHMTSFFYEQLSKEWINVKVWNTNDLEIRKDWIYYENEKQHYICFFYPMEWFFTDKWTSEFWELYKKWEFEIVNNPLNLITQSKAIWAYIHDNLKKWIDMWLSKEEIKLFLDIVPEYRFEITKEEENFVSKPLYFREWVWIDNQEYIELKVFQKRIDQKLIKINTFDWEVAWYLTLWIYMWEDWYIWTYTRFCDQPVTDFTAYYLTTVIKKFI